MHIILLLTHMRSYDKSRPARSPVELEVRREDEFSRMIHGPPHQAQHQDLQPAALQQVDLIRQTQLYEA